MPDIQEIADAQRAALLRREGPVVRRLAEAYSAAWQRLEARAVAVGDAIQQAREDGEEPNPAWLLRLQQTRSLQAQIEAEVRALVPMAGGAITEAQAQAVLAARDDAERLMAAGMGRTPPGVDVSFARLPVEAMVDLIGFVSDGSPLRDELERLGPGAVEQVGRALVVGLTTGASPVQTARLVRKAWGGSLTSTVSLARTATLQSYRSAALRTYNANDDVVTGWRWSSAHSTRTCLACLARDGTVYPLDKPMPAHRNCRCALLPVTRTWASLGYDVGEPPDDRESGVEWFERQPAEVQRQAMPTAVAYRAYRDGLVDLKDFVGHGTDPVWGPVVRERSTTEIIGEQRTRELIRKNLEEAA